MGGLRSVWKISSTYSVLAPKLSTSVACIPLYPLAHGTWLSGTSITGPVFAMHVHGNLFCAVCACIMWIESLAVTRIEQCCRTFGVWAY